jgi:hypothetical protein
MIDSAKNIAIVEPHYDDAWINLGGFILKNPDRNFTIISACYDAPNKLNETKHLEKFLPNVKTKSLQYKGIHYDLRKKLKIDEYKNFFCKLNKLDDYSKFENHLAEELRRFDLVLLPLGFDSLGHHPQHLLISKLNISNCLYYSEFPYNFTKKAGFNPAFLNKFHKIDISGQVSRKIDIFREVYKSQISILNAVTELGKLSDMSSEFISPN